MSSLPPPARHQPDGDAESVSGEVESVFGTAQEGLNPFLWVFPVFEWDDGAVCEADEGEDEEELSMQEQDISRLLPPAFLGGPESELQVDAVLEQALVEHGASGPLPSRTLSPPPTASSVVYASTSIRAGVSPRRAPIGITPMSSFRLMSPPRSSLSRGPVWRSLNQTFAGLPGQSPRTLVSTVFAAPASSAQQAPTSPDSTMDLDDAGGSMGDTARTSSVYALNDSGGSHTVFSDSLRLDFDQLVALGRAPTRQRLSDDEVRTLPRVRFEAPDMQSCSICLEVFRHGMLLTGLQCGHVFHVDCLAQWVQRSSSCPNCRQHIEPCAPPQQ